MIVWGGIDGSRRLDTGARYDPHADTWTPLPTAGAPEGGGYPAVAWAGTHLLVWSRGTGATWDPETNAWSPIASEPLFGVRKGFAFTWSGSKLLLWGGEIVDGPTGEAAVPGAVYTHETNTWRTLERNRGNAGAPWHEGRLGAKLVWTDRTAFLMGGYSYLGPARTIACGGAWSIDVTPPVVTPR